MSNIQEFKEKYSSDNALENELSKIEKMDISNIQKIDLREKVKEKYRIDSKRFTAKKWYCDNIEDNDAFEQRNELGRWG